MCKFLSNNHKCKVDHLRRIGCKCFFKTNDEKDKFDWRGTLGWLLGYEPGVRGYRIYDGKGICVSPDVYFD